MYWLTKHSPTKNGTYEQRFVVSMLGVIGMCCSLSALAGPLGGSVADADQSAVMDSMLGGYTEMVTDVTLSSISGKGGVLGRLDDSSRLAVILWDEGNSNKRRTTNQVMGGCHDQVADTQGLQTVTLTVIQK